MSQGRKQTCIAFRLGGAGYGLEVERAREVTPVRHRVRVPYAPAMVWGAINHRGWVYAAIDTPMWVTNGASMFQESDEARAILLELPNHRLALLVDAIETVGELHRETDEGGEETVVRVGGIRVELLDVAALMNEIDRMIEHVVRSRATKRQSQ